MSHVIYYFEALDFHVICMKKIFLILSLKMSRHDKDKQVFMVKFKSSLKVSEMKHGSKNFLII